MRLDIHIQIHILIHMKNTARITTNIDAELLQFVDRTAKERELTRREVIEESIKKLERDVRAKAITAAYNEMAADKELMGEWLAIANHPANLKW